MKNKRDNYGPRNQGAETKGSRFQGKPSRERKQARENKRYQG